ncbi:hypothetical protein Bca4012_040172 [Brassica carinata]
MLLITNFYHLAFLPEAEDSPMTCDQRGFGSLDLRSWQIKEAVPPKRNKVLLLVVNDWFDPPKNLPAVKSPVVRHFDQNGSYQRMNPMRSHDPKNEANLLSSYD